MSAFVRNLEPVPFTQVRLDDSFWAPDGYLNSHYIAVERDKPWTNLRDCHELHCAGHLLEAAVAYYHAAGKRTLLEVARRYADHIIPSLGVSRAGNTVIMVTRKSNWRWSSYFVRRVNSIICVWHSTSLNSAASDLTTLT